MYQILTWKNKKTTLYYLAWIHLFFFFYLIRDNSIVNLVSRGAIIYIVYKMIRPGKSVKKEEVGKNGLEEDVISEETLKQLYIIVYAGLNKGIQILRNLIQMKEKHISIFVS